MTFKHEGGAGFASYEVNSPILVLLLIIGVKLMRIWHVQLIPILPSQQLIGQWRECSLIAQQWAKNGTPNHLLVNKVTLYPVEHFATYCYYIMWYMIHHGYSPSPGTKFSIENYLGVPLQPYVDTDLIFDGWHNDRYLYQCLSNLEEKYDCGGIPEDEWKPIDDFMNYIL